MQGIEILTSAQVATEFIFNWNAFWITSGIFFGTGFIVGIFCWTSDQCEWGIIPTLSIISIIIGSIVGVGIGVVGILVI